ncbi:hypothetical protein Leryth_025346 [Lithospermum erythrorhizon]|nr:hypothetical protein Leryth_025346 [Lithospermum erythrorhizon]
MEDYTRLWVRLVWFVKSCPMRIFKWTPDFNPSKESPLTPVWVHFHGLPLYLFEGERLISVANTIGKPLRVDSHNVNRVKLGTASVCIELDVSKPLMHETWISFVDDEDPDIVEGFWQKVEYDSVPSYCSKCFHIGHKVDDYKQDMEKEQRRGPSAPYVHRRRQYKRVVNPAKAFQPNSTLDVTSKVPKVYNKSTRLVAPVKESIPTANAFEKLQELAEVEVSPLEAESFGQKDAHMVEPEQGNVEVVDSKVSERVLGSLLGAETLQLDGVQVLPKDFEDAMGDFCKDFKVRSASSCPKLSKGKEVCIQGCILTDGVIGDGLLLDDSQGGIDGAILSPDATHSNQTQI